MPLTPNALERLLLLRLNKGPGPVLDLLAGAGQRALGLALDLEVFEVLASGPRDAATVATAVDADERGVRTLLGFLAALGYVERTDAGYVNTRMTEVWLLDADGVGPWLRFWEDVVFPFWDDYLEPAVREGTPPETLYEWLADHPEQWTSMHEGFRAAARVLAPTVTKRVKLGDAGKVLDVGGGHGLYAATLAERYPDLRATVFDGEPAREVVAETAAEFGVGDRVDFRAGDYETDDLGDGYDAALLFNVIHAHDGPECIALFERIREALVPDGRLYVLDQFGSTARTSLGRATVGFVDLTYLVTLGGRAHEIADAEAWLADAGFDVADRTGFLTAPGVSLVTARRS